MFETGAQTVVGVQVTHPPGTTFDEDGNPIPPPEDDKEDGCQFVIFRPVEEEDDE